MEFHSDILSSILDIPQESWNSIWPYPAEGYHYYLSQEKAHILDFHFSYLVIYHNHAIIAIAPLFITDFGLDLASDGFVQQTIQKIQKLWPRFLKFKTLFCGSLASEMGVLAIHPDFKENKKLFIFLDQTLVGYAKVNKARMIILKDLTDEGMQNLTSLASLGYSKSQALPSATLAIQFPDIEGYLSQISSNARKDLRKKLRKTENTGKMEIQEIKDIKPYIDQVHPLYLNVYNKSLFKFGILTKEFFLNFSTFMPAETIYFLYWAQEGENKKLIGFNFCFNHEQKLVDKFIGMDYNFSNKYNFYFISYLKNIEWCLRNNKKFYVLNQGAAEVKARLGASLLPMWHLTKLTNPWANQFARLFSKSTNDVNSIPETIS